MFRMFMGQLKKIIWGTILFYNVLAKVIRFVLEHTFRTILELFQKNLKNCSNIILEQTY